METEPLLPEELSSPHLEQDDSPSSPPEYLLPVALLAALAMSSTAATAYYAYAKLLCRDASNCHDKETSRYAGSVAVATAIANILGIITLGYLQSLAATNSRLALMAWLACRSMSAAMLLVGVLTRGAVVALSGRIFEGLASDNLLHFILNSAYVQGSQRKASNLIPSSLALYMVGISVSPFVAGVLGNFIISVCIALGIFAITILYTFVFISPARPLPVEAISAVSETPGVGIPFDHQKKTPLNPLSRFLSPLRLLNERRTLALLAITMFLSNMAQSYVFDALLVHTTVRFGFTGLENGIIITIAHSLASVYVFTSLFLLSRIGSRRREASQAAVSLLLQILALVGVGYASKGWQIYAVTSILALSLPGPSFIKSYAVGFLPKEEKAAGLAALAMMEGLSSVFGPIVLGGWQVLSSDGRWVFYGAAGLVGVGTIPFLTFILIVSRRTRKDANLM